MNRFTLNISTDGNADIVNLMPDLAKRVRELKGDGLVHLFAVGSTCALTTIEFEPGLVKHDLRALMQKLVPDDARYEHEMTWNDDNGILRPSPAAFRAARSPAPQQRRGRQLRARFERSAR